MKITSLGLGASHLTANERALMRCRTALELKDKGDYGNAREVMTPLWKRVGEHPEVDGLDASVAAEVLICVGILTSWIGSKEGIEQAQELAKNLIGEGITFYESVGDVTRVASARAEIAYCYFREGALNEARIMLTEALERLTTEGNTRARALLRLAIVECSAFRYSDASRILLANATLFRKITNHAIKGAYHNQLAMVFRKLAVPENKVEYFRRAILEYQAAEANFKLAHNNVFRANVKNNVGNLLRQLSRFKEAHKHLEEARRLMAVVRNRIGSAQVDDTRAQVFIAERKFKRAEPVARNAVRILERSGHQCLLTDALITHGIALARLKRNDAAQFTFQKAIEVAHQVGALNKAGIAALTMIEEVDELSPDASYAAFERACEWLEKSQSQDLLLRLNAAAKKVCLKLYSAFKGERDTEEETIDALLNKPCVLQTEVLKFEGRVIRQALSKANGSVTRAAAMLSMSYQALAYILESRQKDLLKERSPIRRRSRKESGSTIPNS